MSDRDEWDDESEPLPGMPATPPSPPPPTDRVAPARAERSRLADLAARARADLVAGGWKIESLADLHGIKPASMKKQLQRDAKRLGGRARNGAPVRADQWQ